MDWTSWTDIKETKCLRVKTEEQALIDISRGKIVAF